MASVVLLESAVQQYAWGKLGESSAVATLKKQEADLLKQSFHVNGAEPYAELWMGTHPSGPSKVPSAGHQTLGEFLSHHSHLVDSSSAAAFGKASLPFLLKVLSVNQALSIQAHPDKVLAEKLHAQHPTIYRDPNHKPEMTLALTPFEVMCGFRSAQDVAQHIRDVPELASLVSTSNADVVKKGFVAGQEDEKSYLKGVFSALMTAAATDVKREVDALYARLLQKKDDASVLERCIIRLYHDYPGDVGVMCPYVLNFFTLQPGQAIFLGPNEPHAYVSGDCVECMATSDNVVRAGLTPKFRDSATLISMLTYQVRPVKETVLYPETVSPGVIGYFPPVEDFQLEVCTSEVELHVKAHEGPCIGLVTKGKAEVNGVAVSEGVSFFVAHNLPIHIKGQASIVLASVNRCFYNKHK